MLLCAVLTLGACGGGGDGGDEVASSPLPVSPSYSWPLEVSSNGRFLVHSEDNSPFFWLADTAWLMSYKLTREEINTYLENRRDKGYNVLQISPLHSMLKPNVYGATPLKKGDLAKINTTPGSDFGDAAQYDYWDNLDYLIDKAAEYGIYVAIVPIWGSNVVATTSSANVPVVVTVDSATAYAKFLADRYKNRPNIVWFVGGDQKGSIRSEIWDAMGQAFRDNDPNHLISYHPRGRWNSSEWFHNKSWLDFNMFQSGHRTYAQDTPENNPGEHNYGEDNYKYVQADYLLSPVKPTLDVEPSYEDYPKGISKNTDGTRWQPEDVRRYAYWAVFAGAFGHSYGHNSLMQVYRVGDGTDGALFSADDFPRDYWNVALEAAGGVQLPILKKLMLSRSYLTRVPDNSMVADQGTQYDYVAATRGEGYAFFYTYTGRNFTVNLGVIEGTQVKATWFDPRSGLTQVASASGNATGIYANTGTQTFDPPGTAASAAPTRPAGLAYGNDWVLILDSVK
ncbi:glycoside hydrolase family 140 protein [Candidatus Dactylopiibacterium carminicum]|nr:glycoside hydrolase family 140 protein [Candidatus Dactylopiibacterium carminicum]